MRRAVHTGKDSVPEFPRDDVGSGPFLFKRGYWQRLVRPRLRSLRRKYLDGKNYSSLFSVMWADHFEKILKKVDDLEIQISSTILASQTDLTIKWTWLDKLTDEF